MLFANEHGVGSAAGQRAEAGAAMPIENAVALAVGYLSDDQSSVRLGPGPLVVPAAVTSDTRIIPQGAAEMFVCLVHVAGKAQRCGSASGGAKIHYQLSLTHFMLLREIGLLLVPQL